MELCPKCDTKDGAVCDFCCYYQLNDEMGIEYGQTVSVYVGKGFCEFHKRKQDPEDGCNDFKCSMIKEYG